MSAETTSTETVTPPTGETPGAEVTQTVQPGTTAETVGNGTEPVVTPPEDQKLPDTHPLVKAFEAQKEELKTLKIASQSKDKATADLATATAELTSVKAELTSTQAKYGRLESFLTSLGGPIGKALDSKTFSTALFESDTDITELVTKWHKDNPSATSAALGAGAGATGSSKDMNKLLRTAAQ